MKKTTAFLIFILSFVNFVSAQTLLQDLNNDGSVSVVGFGDSISYGQGDYEEPGEVVETPEFTDGTGGYLKRVREYAGLATVNSSVPGEIFTVDGIFRFPMDIANTNSDIVAILEGANDATLQVNSSEYLFQMQKAINIAQSLNKQVVLFTVLPTCCDRAGREPFTKELSRIIRELGNRNQVPVADIETAWATTCGGDENCYLFNIPDGLHPNRVGYDVLGQTFLATLYGINIFAEDGAGLLEEALGMEPGTVVVKPQYTGGVE